MNWPWTKRTLNWSAQPIPREELRRRSRLLVIDDQRPDLIDDLTRSGFAVDYLPDVSRENLNALDHPLYDLILLDFGNVGTTIGSDQGLTILRHIKRVNPAIIVLAYTSKALIADHADFYRIADGVLAKDAGIADSMERIEEGLQKAHSLENIWRGLLNLSGIQPGSKQDKEWQDLAARAIEKPKYLRSFKERVFSVLSSDTAQHVGAILIEKVVELSVKAMVGS
jgi:CheY-like chemotaxis protein